MGALIYKIIVLFLNCYKTFELFLLKISYPYARLPVIKKFSNLGININGPSEFDIQVKNEKEFYVRITNNPLLGFGETYMEGHWTVKNLEELMAHIWKGPSHRIKSKSIKINMLKYINRIYDYLMFYVCNLQTEERSWEVAQEHYDKGNELFQSFLDKSMNYSCGYWKNAKTLDEAQINKMDLIAKKLKLKPGMRVLDIGCGWGGLCKYLAENYQVEVVGCTISKEQVEIAEENCKGLAVDIQLIDYRNIKDEFDRIVSVGMFEHVGEKNYLEFFNVVKRCLKQDGIFLLHTIGVSHKYVPRTDSWFHKYIFPNGLLPLNTDITQFSHGLFVLEDWHNFGDDYSKTLMEWRNNFVKNWPTISYRYDEKFFRMWYFYLSVSFAAFKARKIQLWQIVFSKDGVEGGYESVR